MMVQCSRKQWWIVAFLTLQIVGYRLAVVESQSIQVLPIEDQGEELIEPAPQRPLLYPPRVGSLLLPSDTSTTTTATTNTSARTPSIEEYFQSHPNITIRGAVITRAIPLAWLEEEEEENSGNMDMEPRQPQFRGFQVDLLRVLETYALQDNVTLKFDIEEAPPYSYSAGVNRLANDCNTTENPVLLEECWTHDIWIGDIYAFPTRATRAMFTPPLIETAATSIRHVYRRGRTLTTLEEAQAMKEPVCVLDGSHYDEEVARVYPDVVLVRCYSHDECVAILKQDGCCLFVEDELQLRYLTVRDEDGSLETTRQRWNAQRIVWPISAKLDPRISTLLVRWIYAAHVGGAIEILYDTYFSIMYCPLGFAGKDCTEPCSSAHGISNRVRECVCDSTKWTGPDCSQEVLEDWQLIPQSLLRVGYALLGFNVLAVLLCGIWLFQHRHATQVQIGQPVFLCLVLLGCLISSSAILALGQQDRLEDNTEEKTLDTGSNNITTTPTLPPEAGDYEAHGNYFAPSHCMAIPWLYSVGFSITFGTLFAKIRRVYLIFRAAANLRRVTISVKETITVVAAVLCVDVIILTIWSIRDPLYWQRTVLTQDKYGESLSSEGHCTSDHWFAYPVTIGLFHFALLCIACVMCYVSRGIPTQFSEGHYVSVAMVSNLQIFVVGIPLLIIVGTDPVSSYFVRVAIIWMNDLVVLCLIFGNLMYSVHFNRNEARSSRTIIRRAIHEYTENSRKSSKRSSTQSSHSASITGEILKNYNITTHNDIGRVSSDPDLRMTLKRQQDARNKKVVRLSQQIGGDRLAQLPPPSTERADPTLQLSSTQVNQSSSILDIIPGEEDEAKDAHHTEGAP